jgi:hypothetical protein
VVISNQIVHHRAHNLHPGEFAHPLELLFRCIGIRSSQLCINRSSPPSCAIAGDAPMTLGCRHHHHLVRLTSLIRMHAPIRLLEPCIAVSGDRRRQASTSQSLTGPCLCGSWSGPGPTSQRLRLDTVSARKILTYQLQISRNKKNLDNSWLFHFESEKYKLYIKMLTKIRSMCLLYNILCLCEIILNQIWKHA